MKDPFFLTKLWKSPTIRCIKLLNKWMTLQVPVEVNEQIAPFALINPLKWVCLPSSTTNLVIFQKIRGQPMKASIVKSFSKKSACPSSSLLLSFHKEILAPEIDVQVKHHLAGCDFCYCEIPLLEFYSRPRKGDSRPPELPKNLRILAESILGKDKSAKVAVERSLGVLGGKKG